MSMDYARVASLGFRSIKAAANFPFRLPVAASSTKTGLAADAARVAIYQRDSAYPLIRNAPTSIKLPYCA